MAIKLVYSRKSQKTANSWYFSSKKKQGLANFPESARRKNKKAKKK